MKLSCKNSFMILLAALALMISAVGVTPALADDEIPPPPPTEQPILPPAEEPALPSATEPSLEETATVSGLLEQLPADTSLILLDESGEALPLATGEAVDQVINGDPMWCPAGVTPGNDPLGVCTDQYASLNELIVDLHIDQAIYNGAGTIYIAWDYDALNPLSPDYGTNIVYEYNLSHVTDLTVQGGWVFDDPATPQVEDYLGSEPSDLTGINSLNFLDWGGYGLPASLSIKDIVIDSPGWNGWTFGGGLYVGAWNSSTSGNVELSNVSVTSSTGNGATVIIDNGDISVRDSAFNGNASDGLYAKTSGSITLDEATTNLNGENGAEIYAEGDIRVRDSVLNGNFDSGLSAKSSGSVTLHGVTATGNGTGALLAATTAAQVFCSNLSSNDRGVVGMTPDLYLNEVTFSANSSWDYDNTGNVWINNDTCNTISENQPPLYIVFPQTEGQLPATLGNGNTFASALKVVLTEAGEAAGIHAITLVFPIPDGMKDAKLAVLFWNGSAWVDVPGGKVVGDFFVITVSQPGVYVLVRR